MKRRIKIRVWARDEYICFNCGEKLTAETASVDHQIPKTLLTKGQKQNIDNLVTSCKPCNKAKADRNWKPQESCIIMPAWKAKKYI